MKSALTPLPELSAAPQGDHIKVFLRDCRVELRCGIYENEQTAPQPVIINVEMEAALPHHYQNLKETKLNRVINYELINDFICKDMPQLGHIPLLETIADQIIDFCFKDPRILKASVRIEKPHVFSSSASAGIEISRSRYAK